MKNIRALFYILMFFQINGFTQNQHLKELISMYTVDLTKSIQNPKDQFGFRQKMNDATIIIVGKGENFSLDSTLHIISSIFQYDQIIDALGDSLLAGGANHPVEMNFLQNYASSLEFSVKKKHNLKRILEKTKASSKTTVILSSIEQSLEGCDKLGMGTLTTFTKVFAKTHHQNAINIGAFNARQEAFSFLSEILNPSNTSTTYLLSVASLRPHIIAGKLKDTTNSFLVMALKYDYLILRY